MNHRFLLPVGALAVMMAVSAAADGTRPGRGQRITEAPERVKRIQSSCIGCGETCEGGEGVESGSIHR
jgi:hypothetical protein